jgi:hypothetical protein
VICSRYKLLKHFWGEHMNRLERRDDLLKGAAIGVSIYFFNFGIMSNVFNYSADLATLPGDVITMLFSFIIYSVVTVYVLKKLSFFRLNS